MELSMRRTSVAVSIESPAAAMGAVPGAHDPKISDSIRGPPRPRINMCLVHSHATGYSEKSRAVSRAKLSLLVVLVLSLAVLVVPAATAAPARPGGIYACGTRVDIGVTVFSGGFVKGSGSYTTQSCLAIYSVYLVIMKSSSGSSYSEISSTKVTRYPPEPSSAKFSPRDYDCKSSSLYYYYKTKIKWTYSGGGGGYKYSNTIHIPCT
jgi:hypothetical protein